VDLDHWANDELRNQNDESMTNDQARMTKAAAIAVLDYSVIRHSGFVIHSLFGFRHSGFPQR